MINGLARVLSIELLLTLVFVTILVPPEIVNPISIGFLFLFLAARAFKNKEKPNWSNFNFVSIGFLIFFLVDALSLIYTEDFTRGIQILTRRITFVIIPFLPLFIRRAEVDLKAVSKGFSNAIFIIFFLLLTLAFYRNFKDGYTIEYVINALIDKPRELKEFKYFNYWEFVYDKFCRPISLQPIYLGLFSNIGLALTLNYSHKRRSFSQLLKISVFLFTVLLSASRWQFVLCVGILFYFIFLVSKKSIFNKILVVAIIAAPLFTVVLLNPVLKTRFTEGLQLKEEYYNDQFGGTSIRFKKWSNAISVIQKSPIFGYGIGDAGSVLINQYRKDKFYLGYYYRFNAHNQYLDTMIASGILGLMALFFIIYQAIIRVKIDRATALLGSIYFFSFFTESMLYRQWGIISFVLFLVMFSNLSNDKKSIKEVA